MWRMFELRPARQATPLADICRILRLPAQQGTVTGLCLDSRVIQPGDMYAALPGEHTHGAKFVKQAIAAGATAVVTDFDGAALLEQADVPVLVVPYPREALGALAQRIFGGARPQLVGVTGTNGKTTTTHFIAAVAESADVPSAILGTLGIRYRDLSVYSGRTTPEAPALHAALQTVAEHGAQLAAMEVSSHALALHRIDGVRFDVAVFLGLTQDHLDFHGSMEEYFKAKARLFDPQIARRGVINVDDDWGRRLASETIIEHVTYSMSGDADWTARDVESTSGRTSFIAVGPEITLPVTLALPGGFNVANALAALATAHALGMDLGRAAIGLSTVQVPGRFESIPNTRGIAAYADYAHTPDAVARVLAVARTATQGRLLAVLGCGGDRDPSKRPLMGAAAAAGADLVIVTDDNPRSEDPATIRAAVLHGITDMSRVQEIGDRAAAIARAVEIAEPGDCIMVLGKGHEIGQEIAGVTHPFDDREVLREKLNA